ncbi:type I secretion system permease/ATPase [Derxia gummosa]|uniref:Type I secretion system permease/ATPase n=1 Tax=Derxia gummosa DSM 723 TaxID=1121388 RepID=A0A8B6XAB7_9BURK|nr:type I secretion system permease/ATPase [Derxia gummosa]
MKAFLRDHRRFFVAAGVFSLFINLALLAPSLFMLQVTDRVMASRSIETLVMLGLITLLSLLLMLVLDMLRARLLAMAGVQLERKLGATLLREMFYRPAAGAPAGYALRDLGALRAFLGGAGVISLFDVVWMPVYMGVIFLFDGLLGAIALASAFILVVLALANERLTRRRMEKLQQDTRDASRLLDAVARGGDAVRAMGMADAIIGRNRAAQARLHGEQLGTQRIAGAIGSLTRFFRQGVQVAMLATGAWLVVEQKASPGVMIAVTIILGRALAPVEAIVAQWKGLVEARAAWERLTPLLAQATPGRFAGLPEPTGRVTLEGVSWRPQGSDRAIVRDLTLDIAAGEVLAVIGPSGSGKSTLGRLLVGALPPVAGRVRLDGAELSQWPPEQLGRHVGYLPQDIALFPASIADNIARLGQGEPEAVVDAAKRARAHELIVGLAGGYDTPLLEGGAPLSGGQRQRVALARACYGRPRFVVLDEPNAFLDETGEQALIEAIASLKAEGATVVVITQRSKLLNIADRVVVMRDGAIERVGVRAAAQPGAAGAQGGVVAHPGGMNAGGMPPGAMAGGAPMAGQGARPAVVAPALPGNVQTLAAPRAAEGGAAGNSPENRA